MLRRTIEIRRVPYFRGKLGNRLTRERKSR